MQSGEGLSVSLQLQACDVLDRGRKERGVRSGGPFICPRAGARDVETAGRRRSIGEGRGRAMAWLKCCHIGGIALEAASRCIT